MVRKTKNAKIDIKQMARVFDEQAFIDGVILGSRLTIPGLWFELNKKEIVIIYGTT